MDVERTMEFILAQRAKTDAILAEVAASQLKGERQIRAIWKLIRAGKNRCGHRPKKEFAAAKRDAEREMREIREAQRETDAKFKQLMDVLLKQHKNGS